MTTQDKKHTRSSRADMISVKHIVVCGLLGVVSVVVALVGPFNTFGMGDFWGRLVYWGGLVLSSVVLASFVQLAVARVLPKPVVAREAVIITIFSVLFTPIVILWTDVTLMVPVEGAAGAWEMLAYVVAICVAISSVRYGGPELLHAMMPENPVTAQTPPRFVRRLPGAFSGQIHRLSGDGHYVNVLTSEGVFDVRIRLSDAVDEMDTLEGLWVHRSHWVARDAILHSDKVKGRDVLVLISGDHVPVGAKFRDQLETAGIL